MLHLSPTPATLWIGIIALILIGWLCVVSWKRSPHPRLTAALEVLRFLTALIVVLLLWQPEWLTTNNPHSKPRIAILWDDSKSMTTIDAPLPKAFAQKESIVSRAEWVKQALTSDWWKPLEAKGANEVITLPFATPPADETAVSGTDIDEPLTDLLAK